MCAARSCRQPARTCDSCVRSFLTNGYKNTGIAPNVPPVCRAHTVTPREPRWSPAPPKPDRRTHPAHDPQQTWPYSRAHALMHAPAAVFTRLASGHESAGGRSSVHPAARPPSFVASSTSGAAARLAGVLLLPPRPPRAASSARRDRHALAQLSSARANRRQPPRIDGGCARRPAATGRPPRRRRPPRPRIRRRIPPPSAAAAAAATFALSPFRPRCKVKRAQVGTE